jgi:hypothetical protein
MSVAPCLCLHVYVYVFMYVCMYVCVHELATHLMQHTPPVPTSKDTPMPAVRDSPLFSNVCVGDGDAFTRTILTSLRAHVFKPSTQCAKANRCV